MRRWFIPILVLLAGVLSLWYLTPASHDRDWRADYARLPNTTIINDTITVTNVRNWSYATTGEATAETWIDVQLAKQDIAQLYFVLEPFGNFAGIAHTMLAVTLTDGSGYIMSIEARREVGETYRPLKAALVPSYEYMIVWATERDMYSNSQYVTGDQLYIYELDLTPEQIWTVVHALARETQAIAASPRWYNTLFANCTNVLARTLNTKADADLPWHIARVLPGYTPGYLYQHGLFARDNELSTLTTQGYISPHIDTAYTETEPAAFSRKLRDLLLKNET